MLTDETQPVVIRADYTPDSPGRDDAQLRLWIYLFYIPGPQKMVEALNETVIQMRIRTDKTRKEIFPGY